MSFQRREILRKLFHLSSTQKQPVKFVGMTPFFFQFLRWGLNQRSMSRTLQLATIRSAFCQLQPSAARSLSPNFNLQEKILFMSKSQFIQAHRMKKVITPFPLKKTDFYKKSKFVSQKKGGYPIEKKTMFAICVFQF